MKRHHSVRLLRQCSLATLALICTALFQVPAAEAQSTTPADGSSTSLSGNIEEVVVTGSHVVTSAFNSPTPVEVVSSQRMKDLAIADVGDALNLLPSFRPLTTPSSAFYNWNTNIASRILDLRGLGPQRTLVLVDGHRYVPSNEFGTLDLNEIPSSMVKRAEVVTGGASAAYGADAVAGVVNLILDKTYTGLKTEVSYGISEHGDAPSTHADVVGGTDFADGRGHVVVGIEHSDEGSAGDCFTRSWCTKATNYISNPGWPNNGLPATLVRNNVLFVINPGGVIPAGPLAGTTFDNHGNPVPFKFGSPVSGIFMVGGDASVKRPYLIDNIKLRVANQHTSVYAHADYNITNSLRASLELSYADVKGGPVATVSAFDFFHPIHIDNPYLPAATRQAMIAAGVTTIPVSKLSVESGPQAVGTSETQTKRVMIGLSDQWSNDWSWDAYYQYGETSGREDVKHDRVTARWNEVIDAVRAPDGRIVCRSTLTDPNNGCIPFDYFGAGNGSQAAINWAYANAWQTRKFSQSAAAVNIHGKLFHSWEPGPISVAAGVEYRSEDYSGTEDPLSAAGLLYAQYVSALPSGNQSVTEGYLETSVPLLTDSRWGKSLMFDGAVRYTQYSKSGSATTWKIGAVYRPDDQFLFRVTRSRDIRAPSPAELSPLSTSIQLPLNDPKLHSTYVMVSVTSGNPKLQLENADTFTAGVVIMPHWLKNFRLSADYYDITMGNAIDTISAQTTINLCDAGNTLLCNFLTRDASGQITTVRSTYQNLSRLHARGIEVVSDYSLDLNDVADWMHGALTTTVNFTYVQDLSETSATGAKTEFANWTGDPGSVQNILGVPRYRIQAMLTYSTDKYSITASGRYIPSALLDPTKIGPSESGYSVSLPNSISTNTVSSRFYMDLAGKVTLYDGASHVELFGKIANLFDAVPPSQLRLVGNPLYFDPIGRAYTIGLRANF